MVSSYQTTATYGYLGGTSMAAPMVAGAAAVVWSHMPTRTASHITYRLTRTARDLSTAGYDSRTGWGRLDFLKAVRLYSSVRGVVKLSNGQAVPGAVVKLGNTGRTVTTDSTGKYAFTSVAQAYYSISVTKPGMGLAKTGLTMRDGVAHTVNLTLKPEGALTGPVRDYISGKVLPGATLTVQNATLKATTNSSGSYTLWSLPPGTYKVTASKAGYVSSTRLVTVETGAVKWYGYSLKPQ